MRASPAFRITISRYGVWRAALSALIVGVLAVQAAWLWSRRDDLPAWGIASLAVIGVALVLAAAPLLRPQATELRWDTRCWHVMRSSHPGGDAASGNLAIALDLGLWMLLRFDPHPGSRPRRTRWLPVQRRGLEAEWHALRCAVYCARPAPGADADPQAVARPESQE
ncbi:MAG: hypothetical protein ACJ8G7_03170 [Rhizobacter sp.]